MLERLIVGLLRRWIVWRDRVAVWRGSRVVQGPGRVSLGPADCAVVALVKDAGFFLEAFLRHHQGLGARHILLIDNGSTDDTLEIAARFEGVTVVRNTLPAKRYESLLRAQIAARVLRGGWVLFADADEMFEVPLAGPGALPRLTAYLERHGYTAMVTQMLDLYAPLPYGQTRAMGYAEAVTRFDHFSLRGITWVDYHDREAVAFHWFLRDNICEDVGVKLAIGGLRREVFGEGCFLSKHSLVRNRGAGPLMVHPHCTSGVRVADVTGVLRHYKLAGDWMARDRASVAAGTWEHAEDARRLAMVGAGDGFAIAPAEPLVWQGTADLVERGFLHASTRYIDEMAQKEGGQPP